MNSVSRDHSLYFIVQRVSWELSDDEDVVRCAIKSYARWCMERIAEEGSTYCKHHILRPGFFFEQVIPPRLRTNRDFMLFVIEKTPMIIHDGVFANFAPEICDMDFFTAGMKLLLERHADYPLLYPYFP